MYISVNSASAIFFFHFSTFCHSFIFTFWLVLQGYMFFNFNQFKKKRSKLIMFKFCQIFYKQGNTMLILHNNIVMLVSERELAVRHKI